MTKHADTITTTTPVPPRVVLPADDYERLERIAARALRSRSQRSLAQRLTAELDRADIVAREEVGASVVTMNAGVCFGEEENGEERCVRLVYPGEEVGNPRRLSVFSPLGIALLGLSEGQSVEWTDDDGRGRRVRIRRVLAWPSDAGDADRSSPGRSAPRA